MLKTRENTIRNQFEQQWCEVISFQKPRRVYPAIWYNLKPFADRKGRFKLSIPAKWTLSKGKSLIKKVLKFNTFYVQEIRFSVQNNVVSVCCSYLNMVFPYIGNVKYPHGRTDQHPSERSQTRQRLRYISQNDRLPLLSLYACFHWKLREAFTP